MLRTALFALSLVLLPSPLFAASGDALTGSGTASGWPGDAETETVRGQRIQRVQSLRLDVTADKKADAAYRVKRADYIRERAEKRRDCREDLRRANRDTRLPVLLRCYEEELRDERAFLELTRSRLEAMPGPGPAARDNALSRADLLGDALDTVLFAIGSGVYSSPEDVSEAKRNLLTRYRTPFWDAAAALRADRGANVAGAWIVKVDALRAAETGKPGFAEEEWAGIRTCLMERETALRTLSQLGLVSDRGGKHVTETQALSACGERIRLLLDPPAAGSGATVQ